MEKKSKPLLDTLDVKILKSIANKSKPIMNYSKSLRITYTTFKIRVDRMAKNGWIKINTTRQKVVGQKKYPVVQARGKKVLKFAETYFR